MCHLVFYVCTLLLCLWPVAASNLSASLQQLQVGVEFEASTRMQDTSVSFGYQLDVPKANLQFKGMSAKALSRRH